MSRYIVLNDLGTQCSNCTLIQYIQFDLISKSNCFKINMQIMMDDFKLEDLNESGYFQIFNVYI